MKVSLSPSIKLNKNTELINFGKRDFVKNPATKKEIEIAKTKKIVSEISCVVSGIALIYFAMKVNIKHNDWNRILLQDKIKGDSLPRRAKPVRGIDFRKFMSHLIEHA